MSSPPSRLSYRQSLGYFRRVLAETSGSSGLLSLCLLGSLLTAICEACLPKIISDAIDQFMLRSDALSLAGLRQQGVLYLVMVLLAAALGYLVPLGFNVLGQRVVERWRVRLFAHLHRLPMSYFDTHPVGQVVTRVIYDSAALSEFFTGMLAYFLGDLLKLLVLLIALLWSAPSLTLALLLLAPPLVLAAWLFQRATTQANRLLRRQQADLNSLIQENLEGLAALKAFTAEERLQARFDEKNRAYLHSELKILKLYTLFRPLLGSASIVALSIVLGLGGQQVAHSQMGLGTLVLFIFYLKMIFAPLDDLAERFNVLQTAAVAAERIFEVLDLEVEAGQQGEDLVRCQGSIEFSNVHFAYDPAKPVLEGVSFRIEAGQKLALVGPTGSGKTTITALLQGIYPVQGDGRIFIDGRDLRDYRIDALRRQFGVIQQDLFLFHASLRHNVTLHRQVEPEALQAALRISRAETVVAAHPEGLERMLGERGQQLSQGERQLISFARALIGNPPILILDEATASIDSITEESIQEALREVLAGRTAVIVAHRLSTIQSCDQILVIDAGRIVESGNHQQLMERQGVYAELVRTQLSSP